ncbi:MAG: hypothetical protein ACREXT_19810, partial [Gammaproteobacteria bacterium]
MVQRLEFHVLQRRLIRILLLSPSRGWSVADGKHRVIAKHDESQQTDGLGWGRGAILLSDYIYTDVPYTAGRQRRSARVLLVAVSLILINALVW